ncbi:hypothetical protein ACFQ6N_32900 [Kitasatospora sp. NPDC056446]|uniref:hypothetical protein n=1 Tax=Kitasatospora sp. NPDC056446 TaxID=3345819 RepID=UPI00369E4FD9
MPSHLPSEEAAWLSENYGSLTYQRRELRSGWVAVLGPGVVDTDPDPEALVQRVTSRYGPGRALFASVVTERLG